MKKSIVNVIVDTVSLLVFLTLAGTGLVMRFTLPPGSSGRRQGGWGLWGWGRHDWGDLHFWLGVVLAGLLVLHLVLHVAWIRSMTLHIAGRRQCERPGRFVRIAWSLVIPAMMVVALGTLWWSASGQATPLQQPCRVAQGSSLGVADAGQAEWRRESRNCVGTGRTRDGLQQGGNRQETPRAPGCQRRGFGRYRDI